jgi:hypothetical protein
MRRFDKRNTRRQRGTTTAFMALGMIPMVGIMALAVELGNVAVHVKRLQNYVDSKAVAELKERFGNLPQHVEFHGFTNGVTPGGPEAAVAQREPGHWNFNASPGTNAFTSTTSLNLLAGRAPAYRFEVDPFEVPLLFGPLFEIPSVEIRAEATAFAPRREVVIVQDVSGSMCSPDGEPCAGTASPATRIEQAKAATRQLVQEMDDQQIPGDRVGVISFNNGVAGTQNLTDLNGGGDGLVDAFLAGLQAQGGTSLPTGLQAGVDLFAATGPDAEVDRVIILIGDGTGGDATGAANSADALGINIYTVLFCTPDPTYPCGPAQEDVFDDLTRGRGIFEPAGSANLLAVLRNIVTTVPMKLVR